MESKGDIQLFGTSGLCFDKDSFMRPDFDVDDFMRDYQCSGDGNLETLRDHLGVYLKILRSAMIDLINRDYADFVNLSSNLTGLDSLIQALSVPLGQLREEVLSVSQLLENASRGVLSDLEKQKSVHLYKFKLTRLSEISKRLDNLESLVEQHKLEDRGGEVDEDPITCVDSPEESCLRACNRGELLDCFSAELSHLNFLAATCSDANLMEIYKPRVARLQSTVEGAIEHNLQQCLSLDEEHRLANDPTLLQRTLTACSTLGCTHVAERVVQSLMAPLIAELVNEGSVRSNPRGVAGVLNSVLNLIQTRLSSVLYLTVPQHHQNTATQETVPGFMFLESSVFPEVTAALSTIIDFFSPANPDAFHKKYEQCMEFIEGLEEMLVSRQRVEVFRKLPSYVTLIEKWNFAVYFQIRNQEIGQVVESSLCEAQVVAEGKTAAPYLPSTKGVLRGLHQCWLPEVFLPPLIHRFWKMSLLILSRHRSWLTDTLRNMQEASMPPPPSFSNSKGKLSKRVETAVYLLSDLLYLQENIKALYNESVKVHLQHASQRHQAMIKDTLISESVKLQQFTSQLLTLIIKDVSETMTSALQPVTDTPRLYRRTNRSAPTQPQPYVSSAVSPLQALYTLASPLLPQDIITKVITDICTALTLQYHLLTGEVLGSVSKTEESLKRLKRARGAPLSYSAGAGLSDEDKIREQLHQDVQYLGNKLAEVGVDVSSLPDFKRLADTVRDARTGAAAAQTT